MIAMRPNSFGGSEGAAPIVSCVPGPDASPGASLVAISPRKRETVIFVSQLGAGQQQVGSGTRTGSLFFKAEDSAKSKMAFKRHAIETERILMREVCEILETHTDGSQTVIGRFILEKNKLRYEVEAGYSDREFQELLYTGAYANGKVVTSSERPILWFRLLPRTFSGTTMLRARMVT
jgi:hypothetical protein